MQIMNPLDAQHFTKSSYARPPLSTSPSSQNTPTSREFSLPPLRVLTDCIRRDSQVYGYYSASLNLPQYRPPSPPTTAHHYQYRGHSPPSSSYPPHYDNNQQGTFNQLPPYRNSNNKNPHTSPYYHPHPSTQDNDFHPTSYGHVRSAVHTQQPIIQAPLFSVREEGILHIQHLFSFFFSSYLYILSLKHNPNPE